ncbi:potassium channel family protein [Nocardia sp. CC227C]|uniref:potassium channel family protein n=1 Tax=Nocardia sp. CC227C TaxID=3044562 RepID=UPI00278C59F2|nr:potassium channel family protein [Nocardia sp. CC227C]
MVGRRFAPLRDEQRPRNSALLLAFVVALQFGYPFTLYGQWQTALYMLLYAGMVFFGIAVVRDDNQHVLPTLVLGVVFIVLAAWFSIDQHSRSATLAMLFSVASFMSALIVALLRFIFRAGSRVGSELIMGAVIVYLVLGGLFGALCAAMEILHPGSFTDPVTPGESPQWQQLVYYSYVSLATLGYGDILPVTPWARSLATFESVLGTLFLTIVIARLVGIWSSGKTDNS